MFVRKWLRNYCLYECYYFWKRPMIDMLLFLLFLPLIRSKYHNAKELFSLHRKVNHIGNIIVSIRHLLSEEVSWCIETWEISNAPTSIWLSGIFLFSMRKEKNEELVSMNMQYHIDVSFERGKHRQIFFSVLCLSSIPSDNPTGFVRLPFPFLSPIFPCGWRLIVGVDTPIHTH